MDVTDAYLLAFLPMVSFCCCGYFLTKSDSSSQYRTVVLTLALMSLCQVIAYSTAPFYPEFAMALSHLYLIVSYYFATAFCLHTSRMCLGEYRWERAVYIFPVRLTLGHINGWFVETFQISSRSIVHVDGELAVLVDYYLVFCGVACLGMLVSGVYRSASAATFTRSLLLFPFTAIVVVILSLLVLLSGTSFRVDTSVVVPVVTIYYAWALYRIDTIDEDLTIVKRVFTRFSLFVQLLRTDPTKIDIKEFNNALEKQMYAEQLKKYDYSTRRTAEAMDVHPSTIRAKIKELGIDVPDQQ